MSEQCVPRGLARILFRSGGILPRGENEFHPVPPEGLDGMLSSLFTVAAAQVVGRAIELAAPADALGMCRSCRYPPGHLASRHR